jgi:iron(III) transport system substrate-binding protein
MSGSGRARRIWAGLALLAIGGLSTACGSGATASDSPAQGASSAAQLSGQALVDAAKAEGSLTWYTSYTDTETTALIKVFNQAYPGIKVTTQQGTAADLTARLETEQKARTYKADLVQGDASYAQLLLKSGALQPYSPPDKPTPPQALGMPSGYANVDAVLTTVIAYNPSVLQKQGLTAPTSLQDLTQPQWKGKFSADDTAVNWYESLVGSMGHDQAQSLAAKLGANKPMMSESHTEALTQVQSGEPAASIAVYGYLAAKLAKATPDRVAFVNPNPLPSSPDVIELVRNAPHPAAAELFMDWLLSKDGQTAMHQISGRISLRDDVANEGDAWNTSKWTPAWSNPSADTSTINAYLGVLKQAFGSL